MAGGILNLANIFLKKGKLKAFIEGRRKQDLSVPLPKSGKRYWFHCASLGEFEQARPVMERLKAENSSNSIVVSFFSPSGYEQRSDYALADAVIYLPLDTPANARKVLNYLQADVAVFVKYEIWYFYLKALKQRGIPSYLISATFRSSQFIFGVWGNWLFKALKDFKCIFLQEEGSYHLLQARGLTNIQLSGDTRYDRVKENALKVKTNDHIAAFKGKHPLLIFGSSWQAEEALAVEILQDQSFNHFKVLIVPHDISTGHIDEINNSFKSYGCCLYTDKTFSENNRVMVLNTIGHLSSAYFYADMAVIGGAFGKGLHNILESLSFGVPVVFGPHTDKYPEAAVAMRAEVAMSITNAEDLKKRINYFLPDNHLNSDVRSRCIDFINWHSGATDKVIKTLAN